MPNALLPHSLDQLQPFTLVEPEPVYGPKLCIVGKPAGQ